MIVREDEGAYLKCWDSRLDAVCPRLPDGGQVTVDRGRDMR